MRSFADFDTFPRLDALRSALQDVGIPASMYQDGTSGGLLCVYVPLLDEATVAYRPEEQPHLLLSTEDADGEQVGPHVGTRVVEYTGCVYGVSAEEDVYDAALRIVQRLHLSEDAADVARRLRPLLVMLRAGAAATVDTSSSASRQHYIDTGRYLLQGEAFNDTDEPLLVTQQP